ncbi:D-Ala-D-Ala carboxypeptidase family metallohydrolase [Hoeflea poritis]|uniref:D-Ala-D-Ala carboxypeptidase family metallohydrolase n=1 Tax=Hoeflea poritis TaxID=2993659 RepID=A0ABT4VNF9_9HYPH|nr:D-Ala-D-Ala carboxypeptidase family metallohydrolase [Hoeflea poritis]MDA4846246.1 D-Ala-D-Ala carboxypeptidase family metallohydrolase [Hoeflea poritis]
MSPDEIRETHARLGNLIFDLNTPEDEARIAEKTFDELSPAAFQAALANFREGTPKLARLTGDLFNGIQALGRPPTPELAAIAAKLSKGLATLHGPEGMRTTFENPEEFEEVAEDEADVPSTGETTGLPSPSQGLTRLTSFEPTNSRKFVDLADEYAQFFGSMEYKSGSAKATVMKYARIAMSNKHRYEAVGGPLGIPWWFIAGVHLLESSYNFGTHLHNGDSLNARTHRVPAGRPAATPASGSLPYTWEESARDALTGEKLNGLTDWTLSRALYRWEAYNGFGYRSRKIPTPYLWSFSNIYSSGKFVGDGVFSATAVSKQIGAATLLKALIELDAAENVQTERVVEGEGDAADSDAADIADVAAGTSPNIDGQVSSNINFKSYFETHAPDVTHFEWHEFLVKGGAHSIAHDPAFGLNTDPPEIKWANVLPLARVLQKVRERIGHPVVLTSVYRSPAYNAAIPGSATNSQHVQFKAADFKVSGWGTPVDWHGVVRELRDQGLFSGGIGRYNTFVHVDVRGQNADW